MRLPRLAAALALSAALFVSGCEHCFHHQSCPNTAAAPTCGCNGTAGPVPVNPYPPTVATPPPGAIIHQ